MSNSANILNLKLINKATQCALIKILSVTELNISFLKRKLFFKINNKMIMQITIMIDLKMSDEIFKQILIFIKRKT